MFSFTPKLDYAKHAVVTWVDDYIATPHLFHTHRYPLTCKVTWLNRPESPRTKELPSGCGLAIVSIDLAAKLAIVDLVKRAAETHPRENPRR